MIRDPAQGECCGVICLFGERSGAKCAPVNSTAPSKNLVIGDVSGDPIESETRPGLPKEIEVRVEVDRTFKAPPDIRELGLAFGIFELR